MEQKNLIRNTGSSGLKKDSSYIHKKSSDQIISFSEKKRGNVPKRGQVWILRSWTDVGFRFSLILLNLWWTMKIYNFKIKKYCNEGILYNKFPHEIWTQWSDRRNSRLDEMDHAI